MKKFGQYATPNPFLKSCKKVKRYLAVFLSLCILNLSFSCNYYKANAVPLSKESVAKTIQEFNQARNYAVINEVWHLENLIVNEDEQSISGIARTIAAEHAEKKERKSGATYRYRKELKQPFNELHFKVNSTISPVAGDELIIQFSDIQEISVNDPNNGRKVIAFIASTIGVLFATLLIAAALKSSCPFVYIKNGEEYVFKGELYPGIITPNLQRTDYLPLNGIKPRDGYYDLKVTNELREIQHTDVLNLLVAEHAEDVRLAVDQQGKLYSFSELQPPTFLQDALGAIPLARLKEADGLSYTFNTDVATTESTRSLIIEFDKPAAAKSAKLLLTAKNSLWLDYVFGKFNEQFGTYYNSFQKKQQDVPKAEAETWINKQHIPMSVFIKTAKGWELLQQLNTVGPLAARDIAIPLNLATLSGDKLQVKLECGFMFWELDYAGIDYTENQDYSLTKIVPENAIDETGKDVTALLTTSDNAYLVQAEQGDAVTVKFKAVPPTNSRVQSAFLINRGYYNYIRNYDGVPNFGKLKTFREDFAFTRFSENLYQSIMAYEAPLDLASNE